MPRLAVCFALCAGHATALYAVAQDKSAIPAIMRILKSGRVKGPQLKTVVDLVCRRGNESDLTYLFGKATEPQGKTAYSSELRLRVLQGLLQAAQNRKVKIASGHEKLVRLLSKKGKNAPAFRRMALQLAGAWRAKGLAKPIADLVKSKSGLELRRLALTSLLSVDRTAARKLIDQMSASSSPRPDQILAVTALVALDTKAAAKQAAKLLADKRPGDPASLLPAFLGRKGGADLLAEALAKVKLRTDTAKLALRYMFSIGRSDPQLNAVLDKQAGIASLGKPLTKAQVKAMATEVLAKGDPVRGEAIFRRQDLSCMKCHSVSKAGGNVGPDLSAVGSSTPVDFLINSILFPSLAIKEQYHSTVVVTSDGDVFTGIIVDKAGDQLILRDANGKEVTIAKDDIEDQIKGKSLMPKGLAKFMTKQELFDLVRFLSLLGKPGPLAVRTKKTIQRWRVLQDLSPAIQQGIPDKATLEADVLQRTASVWRSAYAKVAGDLPLAELAAAAKSGILLIRGDVQATSGGAATLHLDSATGVTVWLGSRKLKVQGTIARFKLNRGLNRISFRVDRKTRKRQTLRVELRRPVDSEAQFVVVGGR